MHPVMTALIWTLLAGVVLVGILGSVLHAIPVTGALVVPLLVLVVLLASAVGLVFALRSKLSQAKLSPAGLS